MVKILDFNQKIKFLKFFLHLSELGDLEKPRPRAGFQFEGPATRRG